MKSRSRALALVAVVPCCVLLAVACGGTDFVDPPVSADGAAGDTGSPENADGSSARDVATEPPPDSAFDAALAEDADAALPDDAALAEDADAAPIDAGEDADAAPIDAGPDASLPDASLPDASLPDASLLDASLPDASLLDAAPDAQAGNVPDLAGAKSFAILAGQTVTNSGAGTTIFGDVGVSPGGTVVGLPPGQPTGTVYLGTNGVVTQAQLDLTTLYNDLAGRACPNVLTGEDLAGKKLLPGVYCFSSSAALGVGTLTLDANGDPNAYWIFQIASTLDVALSTVTVINGGTPCNVFWQVGSSATVNNGAMFAGNIVALSSITLDTGASVSPGRALARNGAVTMLSNQVSKMACP